ncbi:uncharacterized protein, partial [Diadema antillarum]|uniref:uncharacterized protein n=2 Tax=Diadema antillarum TaxID=105358 RepID=UPI003A854ABF
MSDSVFKGQILVYSIVGCPHCKRAKQTLRGLSLPFSDVSLDSYAESVRQELKERTGKRTVPQVFFNATHIGGNDDLQALIENKEKLQSLIDDVKNNEPPVDAPKVPDPSLKTQDPEGEMDFTCELDKCAQLIRDLKMTDLIRDHRKGLTTYRNSFQGNQFVDWLVRTQTMERSQAVMRGQEILDRGFGSQIKGREDGVFVDDDKHLYKLLEHEESSALNSGVSSECEPRPASELGEDLRKLILALYNEFLSEDGKGVNYKGISQSPKFATYKRLTGELTRVAVETASREEKLAFFINIYNALVIHAYVEVGPPTNMWQRYKFFNYVSYVIGGHLYSLNDIENGVLRANRKPIGALSKPFSKGDPRLKVALHLHEPLIHFALVCGAKSCPPIKTYSAKDIDKQLTLAGEAFLESSDGCQVDVKKRELRFSRIFKWYREDFGKNDKE